MVALKKKSGNSKAKHERERVGCDIMIHFLIFYTSFLHNQQPMQRTMKSREDITWVLQSS